jgi:hypothetical protein
MLISRTIAQPNKQTFTIPPIDKFIKKYTQGVKTSFGEIVEPFPHPFKQDAIIYLQSLPDNYADVILLDPPYSQRQLKEVYDGIGGFHYQMNNSYWSKINNQCWRVLKPSGVCIKFGWNSSKIDPNAEIIDGMIVCHGSMHNDTIITVQKKMNYTLTNGD